MGIQITITPPAAAAAAIAQATAALQQVQAVYDQANAFANVVGAIKPEMLKEALKKTVEDAALGMMTPLINDLNAIVGEVNRIAAIVDAL